MALPFFPWTYATATGLHAGLQQGPAAIRLGLRLIDGCNEDAVQAIMRERAAPVRRRRRPVPAHRAGPPPAGPAGRCRGTARLSGHRHRARWDISGVENRCRCSTRPVPLPKHACPATAQRLGRTCRPTTAARAPPSAATRSRSCARSCAVVAAWMPHSWPGTATAAVCASPDWCACASGHRPPVALPSSPLKTRPAWSTPWSGATWPTASTGCWSTPS